MRKVDREVERWVRRAKEGWEGKRKVGRNTVIISGDNWFMVYVHGNPIFEVAGKEVKVRTCGWHSNLTRDRLNACFSGLGLPLRARIRKWELVVEGLENEMCHHVTYLG